MAASDGGTPDPGAVIAALLRKPAVTPRRSLILCTDERTGSHLLAERLAATARLGRAYEYFNTPWMRTHQPDYPEDPRAQRDLALHLGTTANGVFSVKLHPWTMDALAGVIDITSDVPDPRFVALSRTDLLGQAISLHKAEASRSYTSWTRPEREPAYDGARIAALLRELAVRRERWEVYFARNAIRPLRITYEQILAAPRRVVGEVARHAGVRIWPRLRRERWFRFERQADAVNAAWRQRFIAEYGATATLDRLEPPARA